VNASEALPPRDSCGHLLVPEVEVRAWSLMHMSSLNAPTSPSYLANTTPVNMSESASSSPDSDTMEPLRVQTQLKSRYTIFDASGGLPFDLVFGLRRRSDSDTRDISFQITRSFLDVPYALANGLLNIHELRRTDTNPNERFEVDLSRLRDAIADDGPELEHFTLPSKSNRTEKRGQMGVTEYRYRVDPRSPLASIFETKKKYSIGLANRDLGIHRWVDSNLGPPAKEETAENAAETCKLVSNPHGGFATFRVIENLVWPPTVETRMHLLDSSTNDNPDSNNPDENLLRVTVTNTGSDVISMQTRGQQNFLGPWGPFQPESDDGLNPGSRPCILDTVSGTSNLQVVDVATGSIVRDAPKARLCGLRSGRPDLRPKLDDLVVLKPGVRHGRDISLDALVRTLDNGQYVLRLIPKGCSWYSGEVESDPGDDGKVSKRYTRGRTSVVLQSGDEVKFDMRDGKMVKVE
jgi:hypothetical protein